MRIWQKIWAFEWGLASIGAGICLVAMMLITVISVFGRYVLEMDLIPGAYNMIERILFPLLILWALPMAHRDGTFPRLEFITEKLHRIPRLLVSIVVILVEIVVYAIVLWFVIQFVWTGIKSGRQMQIGTELWPLWPIIVMMPLAFGLMLLEMIRLVVSDIRRLLGRSGERAL